MIVIDNVADFDLDHIFDCGQCFRWGKNSDGSYTGIARGMPPARLTFQPPGKLTMHNVTEPDFKRFWHGYLDLDRDYGKIKGRLSANDPKMAEIIGFGQGIRILRQDPWETLVTFIISQNNNIPRIKKCIESLCDNFGKSAGEYGGREYFDFPEAEALAGLDPEDLAVCRLGYRAGYITDVTKSILKDGMDRLYSMRDAGAEEAYAYLTGLHGVGPKVANCILLFSLGKFGSFPIDVRVKQAMNRVYGIDREDKRAMAEFAAANFGEYGGAAQQYLFYYIKNNTSERN